MNVLSNILLVTAKFQKYLFRKVTVSDLWMDWLHDYQKLKKWTDSRAIERRWALGKKYVFPFIGNKRPDRVTTDDVVVCFESCAKQTTQTQNKVLIALSQFFKWCNSKNYRNSSKRLPTDRDLLEPYLGLRLHYYQQCHYPAIDWRDVPRFVAFLVDEYGITSTSSKALLFSILTVSRSQSVRLAKWNEIDFEQSEWNIPSEHMKGKQGNNKPHLVPLSRQALSMLKMHRQCQTVKSSNWVFDKNSTNISGNAVRKLIHSIHKRAILLGYSGFTDPFEKNKIIVPHGFRAAFTTWAQETNKNMMLVEKCLAHKDPEDRHNGAYRRGMLIKPRKLLLQQWADFCFSEVQSRLFY